MCQVFFNLFQQLFRPGLPTLPAAADADDDLG